MQILPLVVVSTLKKSSEVMFESLPLSFTDDTQPPTVLTRIIRLTSKSPLGHFIDWDLRFDPFL